MTSGLTEAEVDFETAVGDPSAYYDSPEAIVADTSLSKPQKRRFLTEWAQDLALRQSADSEGMAPADTATAAIDAALLKSVNAAIEAVELQPDGDGAVFRSLWTRLRRMVG